MTHPAVTPIIGLTTLQPSDLRAMATVDGRPVGGDPGVVALDLLHVSVPWRGRGLARTLTEQAAAFAQSLSAHTLYVSATNTAHTVAVYRRFGAVVADPPDPEWFAREPLDVHLRIPLPITRASGRPNPSGWHTGPAPVPRG